MKFGSLTTVTHQPTSPGGAAYDGVTDSTGNTLTIDGKAYAYRAGPPDDYAYQDPGNPPGDWHTYEYESDGTYKKYLWPKDTMSKIHVETGNWIAVA